MQMANMFFPFVVKLRKATSKRSEMSLWLLPQSPFRATGDENAARLKIDPKGMIFYKCQTCWMDWFLRRDKIPVLLGFNGNESAMIGSEWWWR
jgi:hypothetical protein